VKGLRAASGGSRHVCNGSWGGLAGGFSSEGGYSALSAIRHRPDRARSPQMRERSDSDQHAPVRAGGAADGAILGVVDIEHGTSGSK